MTNSMSDKARALSRELIRNLHDLELRHVVRGTRYESHRASVSEGTAARKLGAYFDALPPGKAICPYHLHHAQEELFVVLEGRGTLRAAGEFLPIETGDVIFVPPGPQYPHQIINTSDAPLKYLSISTLEQPEICEYPDSGKYMAEGSLDTEQPFEVIARQGPGLDYWDGEL